MSSATERLAKLREEKEKLAVLSKKVNPKKVLCEEDSFQESYIQR